MSKRDVMASKIACVVGAACLLLSGRAAHAQMTVTTEEVTGRDSNEFNLAYNATDCASDVELTLRVQNIPTSQTLLDFWRGPGTTDCSTEAARNQDTATCTSLNLAVDTTIGNSESTLVVGLNELLDCDGSDGTFSIYILAASAQSTFEAIGADQTANFSLELDTNIPNAPTGVSGGAGNSQVTIRWSSSENETPFEFRLYADSGGDAGASIPAGCPSSVLVSGQTAPTTGSFREVSGSLSSTDINPQSLGLEIDQSAAVAVTTVDQARNESVLSEVFCVSRIETTGFCGTTECDSGTACAAGTTSPGAASWMWLCLVASMLIFRFRRTRGYSVLGLVGLLMWHGGTARAQTHNFEHDYSSPEHFAFELRVGPYEPDSDEFRDFFSDQGPLLGLELDYYPVRIPYVGLLGIGFGAGWSDHNGRARDNAGNLTGEDSDLTLFPLYAVGVLRADVLAREFDVPFVFTAKLGVDGVVWNASTGAEGDGDGITFGLHWAIQVALELNFFNRAAARALDEEWGINSSFLFFEFFGVEAEGDPVVGGRSWSAGLGFTF